MNAADVQFSYINGWWGDGEQCGVQGDGGPVQQCEVQSSWEVRTQGAENKKIHYEIKHWKISSYCQTTNSAPDNLSRKKAAHPISCENMSSQTKCYGGDIRPGGLAIAAGV